MTKTAEQVLREQTGREYYILEEFMNIEPLLKVMEAYAAQHKEQTEGSDNDFYVPYLKKEKDFQEIQLKGLGISEDIFFEQRINTAIAMAWKAKVAEGSGEWKEQSR